MRFCLRQPSPWIGHQDVATLNTNPDFRRAGNSVLATYGSGYERTQPNVASRKWSLQHDGGNSSDQYNDKGADLIPSPSLEQVREYVRASKAENTLRGYRADWRDFCSWCEAQGVCPLPSSPETVAAYIAECAGRLKVGSIQRRINAIAEAHKAVGLESPTHHTLVTNTMKGIRRMKGTAPTQKVPTLTEDIRAMVDATDAGIIGVRDRALVLLGFAGAFRRSELVALDVEDCNFRQGWPDGHSTA